MKVVRTSVVILLGLVASAHAQAPSDKPVVRLDPALDALVAPDAKLDRVATGFGFTEGIIWVPQGRPLRIGVLAEIQIGWKVGWLAAH